MLQLANTNKKILNKTLVAQEIIPTISKWNLMKIVSFCTARETEVSE